MPPEIAVTVVTVTWNSEAVIREFLESVPAAMGGSSWQLVVADNGSRDATVEIARSTMPNLRLVQLGHNAGYAAGINAGVAAAGGDTHLVVANPDIRLDAGSGEILIATLGEPGVGVAVPQLRDAAGHLTFSLHRDPTVLRALGEALIGGDRAGRWGHLGETVRRPEAYDHAADVDWASGAILAV